MLWQAVGNQESRQSSTSGLRRAGRAVWGVIFPNHVPGFSIFLLRSLTCSRKNNRGVSGYLLPRRWSCTQGCRLALANPSSCTVLMLNRLSTCQDDCAEDDVAS